MSLFSGMLDTKLEARFGRISQHRQQSDPIPSIEYPSQHPSVPPPKLGEQQEGQPQDLQQQEQYYNDVAPVNIKKLRAEDVGFFDPEYVDEKTTSSGNTQTINTRTVNTGRHVIYRDVYTFVDRLKHVAYSHGNTAIVAVISECLRGGALMWHTDELTDFEKSGPRTCDLQLWYTTLIDRFKMRTTVAIAHLNSRSQTYGLRNMKNQTPRAWIQ